MGIIGSFILTAIIVASLVFLYKTTEQMKDVLRDRSEVATLVGTLEGASAYLTNEAGKGFPVVADEVRKLAEQSNQSATRITEIIHSLQKKVNQTTGYMEQVTTRVDQGVAAVQETGYSFEGIMESTTTVSDKITGVSAIAQQMAA